MPRILDSIEPHLADAVRSFWTIRNRQQDAQGQQSGERDRGNRSAVTGGRQLDGFVTLIRNLLLEGGLDNATIFTQKAQTVLPGFYRPTKEWDLVVVVDGELVASIEFKSQIGPSFGNNFNNRIEEALGNATDLWTAYREGAFRPSPRPWLGYVMLLEDCEASNTAVGVREPHFPVFADWKDSSYAKRYELFCQRLVRERLYEAACFLLCTQEGGLRGEYREPSSELSFRNFAISLIAKATAVAMGRTHR